MSTPVTLTGRLTADPELKFSQNGKPVAQFTVVTSRRLKDEKTGEWSDRDTSFWNCVAFGQLAENIAESLAKGTAVLVTGNAVQRSWETPEGDKRRTVEVIADEAAPSLRWASAKVTRVARSGAGSGGFASTPASQPPAAEGPWEPGRGYSDEPPF